MIQIFFRVQKLRASTSPDKMAASGGDKTGKPENFESFEETPLLIAVLTYFGYGILIVFGHLRDFMRNWGFQRVPRAAEPVQEVGFLLF